MRTSQFQPKSVRFNIATTTECTAFVGTNVVFTTKDGRQVEVYEIKENQKVKNPLESVSSSFHSTKLKDSIAYVILTLNGWTDCEILQRTAAVFFTTIPSDGSEKTWTEGVINIKKNELLSFECIRKQLKQKSTETELALLEEKELQLEKAKEEKEKEINELEQMEMDIEALCNAAILQ